MKLIAKIPYSLVNFRFISNHYDIHYNGTCVYNSNLCEFKTNPEFDEEGEWINDEVEIYSLTKMEKYRWKRKQWLFEQCIGYHWSYGTCGNKCRGFYYRNPKWFYKMLFKIYYLIK